MGVWPSDIFEKISVGCSGVGVRKEEVHGDTDACIGCARKEAVFSHPSCRCLYHRRSARVLTSCSQKRKGVDDRDGKNIDAGVEDREVAEEGKRRNAPAGNAFPDTLTHTNTHTEVCTDADGLIQDTIALTHIDTRQASVDQYNGRGARRKRKHKQRAEGRKIINAKMYT